MRNQKELGISSIMSRETVYVVGVARSHTSKSPFTITARPYLVIEYPNGAMREIWRLAGCKRGNRAIIYPARLHTSNSMYVDLKFKPYIVDFRSFI